MKKSLLSILELEQNLVKKFNDCEKNYDYYLESKNTSDDERPVILDYYKRHMDLVNKRLPEIRKEIAFRLKNYINYIDCDEEGVINGENI